MGTPDTITKTYMSDSRIFADACNYFFGEKLVIPEELETLDPTELLVLFDDLDDVDEAKEKRRDILKRMSIMKDNKAVYVLLGIENQTLIDYAMPIRILLYDAIRYNKQVADVKKSYKKDDSVVSHDEFVTKFRKGDYLYPIVTFVVYYGSKPWDGAKSIHDMLPTGINDKILSRIQNYAISIIEPATMTDADLDTFTTSLREVFMYIKCSSDKNKLKEVKDTNQAFHKVERKAVAVINAVTNSKIKYSESEENIDMCKAISDMQEEIRLEEKANSLKEKIESIKRFIDLKVDYNTIAAGLGLSVDEVKRLAAS